MAMNGHRDRCTILLQSQVVETPLLILFFFFFCDEEEERLQLLISERLIDMSCHYNLLFLKAAGAEIFLIFLFFFLFIFHSTLSFLGD